MIRMAKRSLLPIGMLALSACHNPRAANKSTFTKAIQESLDKKQSCLIEAGYPKVPYDSFADRPITSDLQSETLLKAGLVKKEAVQVRNPGAKLFGGPETSPGVRYSLTAEGEKYAGRATPGMLTESKGAKTLCYGIPEVKEVVRYTEPSPMMGQTMTEVTYVQDLKNKAPWIDNPEIVKHFQVFDVQPSEHRATLVLSNDGWHVASAF